MTTLCYLAEEAERDSLVSAVTDRVKRLVREALERGEIEMSQLVETKEKLKKGSEELKKKIQDLEDERVCFIGLMYSPCVVVKSTPLLQLKVEAAVDQLKMRTVEIQSVIEQLEQQDDINVDEAVTGSNAVYNQSVS